MTKILDGRVIAAEIKTEVAKEVEELKNSNIEVTLAVIIVGDDPASQVYVRNKEKACASVGIKSITHRLQEDITQIELESLVQQLAFDTSVHGILVQLPLPKHLDKDKLLELIPANKDVDGLTASNVANLVLNKETIVPCTPQGVIDLLKAYNIELAGKNIAVIGRSMLVGRPLSILLSNADATVTVCHSKTNNLAAITKSSDIVICAVGKPKFLTADMVNSHCVIIDVGINRLESGLCGDADYDSLVDKVQAITPVPGSCGLMTIAELLVNTVKCCKLQKQ